jgi:hypothetical protein
MEKYPFASVVVEPTNEPLLYTSTVTPPKGAPPESVTSPIMLTA